MTRAEILEEARKCVCGDREEDYGSPENNFRTIADLWTVYLGTPVTPKEAAIMMALLKIARIKAGTKTDNFVDLAGYAACAGEIAENEDPECGLPFVIPGEGEPEPPKNTMIGGEEE